MIKLLILVLLHLILFLIEIRQKKYQIKLLPKNDPDKYCLDRHKTQDMYDMGLNTINFDNIDLDNDNFDEGDPKINIHVRLMAWCNRYKQCKACKKQISK